MTGNAYVGWDSEQLAENMRGYLTSGSDLDLDTELQRIAQRSGERV